MPQLSCPNCRQPVPMGDLWKNAPMAHGSLYLRGSIVVLCPHCQTRLRVHQHLLVATGIGSLLLFALVLSLSRSSLVSWVIVAFFTVIFLLLQSPLAATLLRFRPAEADFHPTSTVTQYLEVSSEAALRLQQSGSNAHPWRCERCGRSNDVIFAICPRCESPRWTDA